MTTPARKRRAPSSWQSLPGSQVSGVCEMRQPGLAYLQAALKDDRKAVSTE